MLLEPFVIVKVDRLMTNFRLLQLLNAEFPMLVTLLPITTLVRPEQLLNAELPMLVTLLGIVTLVSPGQYSNAFSPTLVSVLGKSTFASAGQLSNAHLPKEVTPSGIVTSISPVRLNVPCSMTVKDDGNSTLVRLLQRRKASLPMLLIVLGSIIEVKPPPIGRLKQLV